MPLYRNNAQTLFQNPYPEPDSVWNPAFIPPQSETVPLKHIRSDTEKYRPDEIILHHIR